MDFSQYLDPLKERLIIFAELVKERAAPLLELMESMPYYPYSVMGIAAAILLLLILLMVSRKRSAASKSKQAKASGADRPRPRVSGVAVGLSSHEEFNYGNTKGYTPPDNAGESAGQLSIPVSTPQIAETPVFTAPVPPVAVAAPAPPFTPIPVNTAPAVTVPIITAPTVTIEAPAPTPPSAADSELEATIKSCQEKFQAIYMEMYGQFGLSSDFDRFRTEVVNRLSDAKITHRAITELKMTPEGLILAHMASVAGGFLQSGHHHTGKGQMDISGQKLLTVYRYALNTMREKGLASPADVQNKLDYIEKKVLEIGG